MKNNHLRMILCLFMCCLLLFTCVSRPASATSVAVVAGLAAIPTAVAVACAFQALGVMSATNSTDFTTTVDSCSNWLIENSSFVVNGTVALLGLTQAGNTVSYLNKDFIQSIWEWLFNSNTVVSGFNQTAPSFDLVSNTDGLQSAISRASSYSNILVGYYKYNSFYRWIVFYSDSPIYFYKENGANYVSASSGLSWINYDGYSYSGPYASVSTSYYALVPYSGQYNDLLSNEDVTLGNIQSPFQTVGTEEETIQIEIAPIYIDWTKYGVPDPNEPGGDDPDNDGKFPMWLPTGIPSPGYDDSVITQNQEQAQSGVVSGDITFEPYEPDDPGTGGGGAGSGTDLSSVIQAIVNVPTAIVSGIGDFISDFFGFNGNYEDYTVQLRDFFPFCIPFDLYDFITVLSAEPEAPVFHWEIPVPQLGQTFELEVDLSAWDDIAVLFRNLELLAFIFGLAILTREKFLRS